MQRHIAPPPGLRSRWVVSVKLLFRIASCAWIGLTGAIGATPASAAPSQPGFEIVGWQFHEYDVPKVAEAIRRAPAYGVNTVIFSHELFRSVEGFLASGPALDPARPPAHLADLRAPRHFKLVPGWQADINHLGALAAERGIEWYLWIHEFDDLPKRFISAGDRVNLDHPDLPGYLTERYQRLIAAAPGVTGFCLTFHESDRKPFRNTEVTSALPVPERLERITRIIHDVARRHGKKLIVRNFFYEPAEMALFAAALERMPDDLIVMSKTTVHEFHPFYPADPMHGQVGRKRQVIEIDLGVEKAWSRNGAYSQAEYIQRYVRRARDLGLAGMIGRCRLFWERPFEDTHEVNLFAFARFLRDPGRGVDDVLQEWARQRYPAVVAPEIARALGRTQFIHHHGRYHLENWFTKSIGEQWGDYRYYYGHLVQRSRYKWSRDPRDEELERRLQYPDEATYQQLVAEKDEVLRQVEASRTDIERAARHLEPGPLRQLREDFDFLHDAARLQREWVRAYFAMRLYMEKPAAAYLMWMEDALARLEAIERTPGVTHGLNPATGRRHNIDRFVLEMRWRVANRSRAIAEDRRITEDMRATAAVADR